MRVELALVPADRRAHDQPAVGDVVDGGELLGQDHGIAHRHHQDAGADLDLGGAGGDRGQDGQRLVDREVRLDAEQDVVPRPQRLVAQLLHAHAVVDQRLRARHLRILGEVAHRDAELGLLLLGHDCLRCLHVRCAQPRVSMLPSRCFASPYGEGIAFVMRRGEDGTPRA